LKENDLSNNLKNTLIGYTYENSTRGHIAANIIVLISEAPISLYHSYVKSGYEPLKGKKLRYVSFVFALVNNNKIAVLKNYATKILYLIALVYSLSV
jgi:hypothetical protein